MFPFFEGGLGVQVPFRGLGRRTHRITRFTCVFWGSRNLTSTPMLSTCDLSLWNFTCGGCQFLKVKTFFEDFGQPVLPFALQWFGKCMVWLCLYGNCDPLQPSSQRIPARNARLGLRKASLAHLQPKSTGSDLLTCWESPEFRGPRS